METVELRDTQSVFSVLDQNLDCHNVKAPMQQDQEEVVMMLEYIVMMVRANV